MNVRRLAEKRALLESVDQVLRMDLDVEPSPALRHRVITRVAESGEGATADRAGSGGGRAGRGPHHRPGCGRVGTSSFVHAARVERRGRLSRPPRARRGDARDPRAASHPIDPKAASSPRPRMRSRAARGQRSRDRPLFASPKYWCLPARRQPCRGSLRSSGTAPRRLRPCCSAAPPWRASSRPSP